MKEKMFTKNYLDKSQKFINYEKLLVNEYKISLINSKIYKHV